MYYELYIDEIFLENLLLDFLLLLLTGLGGKFAIRWRKLFLSAFCGSLTGCMFVVFHMTNGVVLLLGQVGISVFMVKWGFSITEKKRLGRGLLFFYGTAFLLGGILETLHSRITLPVILSGTFGALLLCVMLRVRDKWKNETQNLCRVTLVWNGMQKELYGFRDTGNQLRDPYFGKPVTVVEYSAVKELFNQKIKVLWIPYHSVGSPRGWMPGVQLDYFLLHQEEGEKRIEHPIVAISKETISTKGNYQMILPSALTDD